MTQALLKMTLMVGGAIIFCAALLLSTRVREGVRPRTSSDLNVSANSRRAASHPAADDVDFRTSQTQSSATIPDSGMEKETPEISPPRIAGHVFGPDGDPIPGAILRLSQVPEDGSGRFTTSKSDGSYEFQDPAPRKLLMRASVPENSALYPPEPIEIVQKENRVTTGVDFHMKRGLTVFGFVYGTAYAPLSNAYVAVEMETLVDPNRSESTTAPAIRRTGRTDQTGYFEIGGIRPGTTKVRVSAGAEGYRGTVIEAKRPFEEAQKITLQRASQLLLVAVDQNTSLPLERFRYRLEPTFPCEEEPRLGTWVEPVLEKQGEAHVGEVPSGEWRIHIQELSDLGFPTGRTTETLSRLSGGDETVILFLLGK